MAPGALQKENKRKQVSSKMRAADPQPASSNPLAGHHLGASAVKRGGAVRQGPCPSLKSSLSAVQVCTLASMCTSVRRSSPTSVGASHTQRSRSSVTWGQGGTEGRGGGSHSLRQHSGQAGPQLLRLAAGTSTLPLHLSSPCRSRCAGSGGSSGRRPQRPAARPARPAPPGLHHPPAGAGRQ